MSHIASVGTVSSGQSSAVRMGSPTTTHKLNGGLKSKHYHITTICIRRQLDVFKLDLMCVPVNVRNVHWALGVVNFRLKKITFLDSFQSNIPPREFYAGICRYLHDEHIDKKGLPLTKGWVFDSNLVRNSCYHDYNYIVLSRTTTKQWQ